MRVLLTHGYFLNEDPKERQIMKPYPPLGILYLCSHLRARGLGVEVYDSTFGSRDELFRILETGPPGVIGIYGNLMTRRNVINITGHAQAAGWQVILGGPEPANYANEYLSAGADVIVAGEGEIATERLLLSGMERTAWPSIPGIIYADDHGRIVRTGSAQLLTDLDAQPWPAREHVDIHRYLKTWRDQHGTGSVSVITARGCPYSCNWCSHSVYGKTHRRRSPISVADEVECLLDTYHPDMVWIADDVFTIHHGWIERYAAELKGRSIRIPFECITRADRLTPHVASLLAELGCMRIWIGSESGSQRILDAMERGVTVEQVQAAVALCKANGIATGMFLMWGYEGEQVVDVEATVEHVKRCRPDTFLTTVSYPIRGTPYYDKVADRLVRIGEWNSSTDRDVTIRGRHSRRFYQYADSLLKLEMDPERNVQALAEARAALLRSAGEVEA